MWTYGPSAPRKASPNASARTELDRNLAEAHANIGFGKIFIGRAEEAEAHIAEGLRLTPRDLDAYKWMGRAGLAKLHLGNWEQATAWYRRSIEANRNFPYIYFVLRTALPQLDRLDEARSATKAGLALNPTLMCPRFPHHLGGDERDDPHPIFPSLSLFSKACARPAVPEQ